MHVPPNGQSTTAEHGQSTTAEQSRVCGPGLSNPEGRERARRLEEIVRRANLSPRHGTKAKTLLAAQEPRLWSRTLNRLRAKPLHEGYLFALVGGRGSGKSQLATCLLIAAAEFIVTPEGKSLESKLTEYGSLLYPAVLYIKAIDLYRRFCDFNNEKHSEAKVLSELAGVTVLAIDEPHESRHTAFEQMTLTNLLDHRYDRCLATLLVSNDDQASFEACVGPSIISRMNETGGVIDCSSWPDIRGK